MIVGKSSTVLRSILLLALFQVACDEVLMRQPTTADLVGVYHLTDSSRAFLFGYKHYSSVPDSRIEIARDMRIDIRDLPDCADDGFGDSHGRFLSGHGSWELRQRFPGYGLDLRIEDGGTLRPGYYAGPWIRLRRASPPHELEITVGDPDSGEVLRYSQRAPS